MERRLAAILAADVVGYSRLMGADETGTLAALKSLRAELFDPRVADHNGRIVKLMGDGALVEFASVVGAVDCAAAIQRAMAIRNAGQREDKRIEMRIGINLGDVIIDGDDIYGDGVNVAARLEGLAEPGGVCVSGAVFDQVKGKLDIDFEDMGPQSVKNIDAPVRAYSVVLDAGSAVGRQSALPDKPSIAVLPFANMSGDPEQEYFADGITEDIITALSNVRTFTVLARNSTFVYKGRSVDAREIGNDLNVHYLIEGSVRRVGDRVRVTAQLIDTTTGDHIWADRYDGTLDDIFDLQDRITSTIVGTIEPELVRAVGMRLLGKPPSNMDAYDQLLRGLALMYKVTPEDTEAALRHFEKAIEIDPAYGRAYAFASWCYRRDVQQRGLTLSEDDRRKAIDLARQALRYGRDDPFVLVYAASTISEVNGDFDEGLALVERALKLNPNSHRFWNAKAKTHALRGDTAEAIEAAQRAIDLSPNNPAIWVAYWSIAEAHLQELRYEEAIDFARRALRHNENIGPAYYIIAAAAAQLGRAAEARQALDTALGINPGMTLTKFPETYLVGRMKNLEAYLDGLRKAGLPE